LDTIVATPPVSVPQPAPLSADEAQRLQVLGTYAIDSLQDDPELTQIARFAAKLCDTPVALVSLVEDARQRFLAAQGLAATETSRDVSFCSYAMLQDDLMQVFDASLDPLFAANPLVTGEPHIRFYAGQPLTSEEGLPLGSLCVIDTVPRPEGLTPFQREGLAVLAQATMRRLRSRRHSTAARREHELREADLQLLADSIPTIAFAASPDGRPTYFNQQFYEFTGAAPGSVPVAGQTPVHADDYPAMRAEWEQALADAESFEFEYRLRRHDGEYRWMISRAVPVHDGEGRVSKWFGTITDIDETRRLSETRDMLARELSHRIKNIFAVVSGLVSLSVRRHPEHKPFATELIGTIHALGRAHDYVRETGTAAKSSLHGLLADLFDPYCVGGDPCVEVTGDDVAVLPHAATPLALVFHELATNSAKYGALSVAEGHVELAIEDRGDTVQLRWSEHDGPAVQAVPEDGFGSRLVEMSVTGTLRGSWERRFEPDGLVIDLTISKPAISG
jgi:PAS domain S-box-containing protein